MCVNVCECVFVKVCMNACARRCVDVYSGGHVGEFVGLCECV